MGNAFLDLLFPPNFFSRTYPLQTDRKRRGEASCFFFCGCRLGIRSGSEEVSEGGMTLGKKLGDGSRLIPMLAPKYLGVGALWPYSGFFKKEGIFGAIREFFSCIRRILEKTSGLPPPPHPTGVGHFLGRRESKSISSPPTLKATARAGGGD